MCIVKEIWDGPGGREGRRQRETSLLGEGGRRRPFGDSTWCSVRVEDNLSHACEWLLARVRSFWRLLLRLLPSGPLSGKLCRELIAGVLLLHQRAA